MLHSRGVPGVALHFGSVSFNPLQKEMLPEGGRRGWGDSSVRSWRHELEAQVGLLVPDENAQVWGVPFGLST